MKMRVLDLFCGLGGFSFGFKQAGFEISVGIDKWEAVRETFETNTGGAFICADMKDIRGEDLIKRFGPIDVVIGGPPCVSFSQANRHAKKNGTQTDGLELVREFFRILQEIRIAQSPLEPLWVMENVKASATWIRNEYPKISMAELNSMDFGVPQHRIRNFYGMFEVPSITHMDCDVGFQSTLDGRVLEHLVPISAILEPDAREHMISGRLIRRLKKKHEDLGREHLWHEKLDRPGRTMVANDLGAATESVLIPIRDLELRQELIDSGLFDAEVFVPARFMTILEKKRYMGFPDTFIIFGSELQATRMLGNAVSPPVAKAIAEGMKER